MVDAPGRAMRPVDANFVADLAAEQVVAGYAERLGLDVEQRILDGAERQRHHAAGGGARRRKQLGIDSLVLEGVLADDPCRQPLDRGSDAGRAKPFVEFAPADEAVFGHDLDEMVVPPARVAGQGFDTSDAGCLYAGCLGHDFLPGLVFELADNNNGSADASITGRVGHQCTSLVMPRLTRASTSLLQQARKTWMAGHRRAEATPSFGRLCPAMTEI